jgi:hypothetical protein
MKIMKRMTTLLTAVFVMATNISAQSLSKEERKKAIENLKVSQVELQNQIKGLSEEQLNFKATTEAWSIAECVEHIAIAENNIFGIVQMTLQEEPDPSKRSEVQMTDEQVLGLITSRDQKVKTRKEFEPTNSFRSYVETVSAFNEKRKSNMKYVKSTDDDLRNRYFQFPFGTIDSYQVILFMSGHTQRHIDQIKEVKASDSFPAL